MQRKGAMDRPAVCTCLELRNAATLALDSQVHRTPECHQDSHVHRCLADPLQRRPFWQGHDWNDENL